MPVCKVTPFRRRQKRELYCYWSLHSLMQRLYWKRLRQLVTKRAVERALEILDVNVNVDVVCVVLKSCAQTTHAWTPRRLLTPRGSVSTLRKRVDSVTFRRSIRPHWYNIIRLKKQICRTLDVFSSQRGLRYITWCTYLSATRIPPGRKRHEPPATRQSECITRRRESADEWRQSTIDPLRERERHGRGRSSELSHSDVTAMSNDVAVISPTNNDCAHGTTQWLGERAYAMSANKKACRPTGCCVHASPCECSRLRPFRCQRLLSVRLTLVESFTANIRRFTSTRPLYRHRVVSWWLKITGNVSKDGVAVSPRLQHVTRVGRETSVGS